MIGAVPETNHLKAAVSSRKAPRKVSEYLMNILVR